MPLNLTSLFTVLTLTFFSFAQKEELLSKSHNGLIDIEGGKLWYNLTIKNKKAAYKTPLIHLHGGPGGTSGFNLSVLADERPVIVFDQLGNGRSTHHRDTTLLTIEHLVEQVRAVVEHFNFEEFYLSGGSWGTALALEYYDKYPKGVKGLIFNSPYFSTPIWTADADTLIMAMPDSIQSAIAFAESTGEFNTNEYQAANRYFLSLHGRRTAYKRNPADTIPYDFDPFIYNYMWGPSEFTATGTLKNYDNHLALKEVQVPTLFTTGEFDEARPATIARLSKLVPISSFVVIEGAGHFSSNDNLQALEKAMREFMIKVDHK